MRLIFSALFSIFIISGNISAQPAAIPQLKLKAFGTKLSSQPALNSGLSFHQTDSAATKPLPGHLPLDFYSQHIGVACKMELQLEKQTKLPIRIRLGSKEQVDYLEGKFSRNR